MDSIYYYKSITGASYVIQSRTSSKFNWRDETRGSWPDTVLDEYPTLERGLKRFDVLSIRYGADVRLVKRVEDSSDTIIAESSK